jgi:hypothetical protein
MLQDLPEDLISTTQDILHEARRNPEMNPRIGPLTRLREYKDDPNIFISFTEIDKAGLNPLSRYETPLGVYTYPLKVSWDYYGVGNLWKHSERDLNKAIDNRSPSPSKIASIERQVIQNAFPFATESPYIQVIRAKKPLTDLQKFSKSDYENSLDAIENIIKDTTNNTGSTMVDLYRKYRRNIYGEANVKTHGGLFWYLTYLITTQINDLYSLFLDRYKTNKRMRAWNYLLRELGHDGFIDKGDSIIHPGESAQAVFLHRGAFKKVDRILNKASVLSQKKKKIGTWMNDNEISKDAKWYIETEATENRPALIRWESGTFIDGVWKLGRFKGGTFAGGIWKKGIFEGGTFEGGTFEDGRFEAGRFIGGTFAGGTFKSRVFEGGTFADGVFVGHKFTGGTFAGGTFKGSIFRDAIWEDGVWFPDGIWVKGDIYSKKFQDYVFSRKDPNRFAMIEAEVDTIEELAQRVKDPL